MLEAGGGVGTLEVFIRPNHKSLSLSDLLPMAFGPIDLGETDGLFKPRRHQLALAENALVQDTSGVWGRLVNTALDCAIRSYSPYSHSPAGVALLTNESDTSTRHEPSKESHGLDESGATDACAAEYGEVLGGSYYENCAFNPSISPAKSALVAAVCAQRSFASISRVVLVELEGAPVSHAHETRALIASLSPLAEVRVTYARRTQM